MKNSSSIALVAVGGLLLWAMSKKSDGQNPVTGSANEATELYGDIVTATPGGALSSQSIRSTKEGIDAINKAALSGNKIVSSPLLIKPNTTFQDARGNTYRTGSNQGVANLIGGTKVLTVTTAKTDSSGKTAWDKRIEANKAASGAK